LRPVFVFHHHESVILTAGIQIAYRLLAYRVDLGCLFLGRDGARLIRTGASEPLRLAWIAAGLALSAAAGRARGTIQRGP
jgi:hypothetical protein